MSFLKSLLNRKKENQMKKILLVGLGNVGEKYKNTRHNIGFQIVDAIASEHQTTFETDKLGDIAHFRFKGKLFILLKPRTYMNLSGKAVKHWMTKEKVLLEDVLIITDDVNIDFGTIRIKAKGSAGGHNGLKGVEEKLNSQKYARFRFGVGNNFSKGRQVDYVLGEWTKEEESLLIERIPFSVKAAVAFGTDGIANTMNNFNGSL